MTDVDALCADYLNRLDSALSNRSLAERRQIVEQITEHLKDAHGELPEQSEVAVRSILDRLGSPEEIAAEAPTGEAARTRASWIRRRKWPIPLTGLVLAGLGVWLGISLSVSSPPPHGASAPVTTTQKEGTTVVPVVLGERIPQATITLQSAGLTLGEVNGGAQATVVSQSPSGGSRVPSGSEVQLTTGSQPSTPPATPTS